MNDNTTTPDWGIAFSGHPLSTDLDVEKELLGATIKSIDGAKRGSCVITLETDRGFYVFQHHQDCCESVSIEDVCGDVQDLIGSPLTMAEEVCGENPEGWKPDEYCDSYTWTFYKFATVRGYVTIRWYGESNGYYSESVSLDKIIK